MNIKVKSMYFNDAEEVVVVFSNRRYHSVKVARPYSAKELAIALRELAVCIVNDTHLKKEIAVL